MLVRKPRNGEWGEEFSELPFPFPYPPWKWRKQEGGDEGYSEGMSCGFGGARGRTAEVCDSCDLYKSSSVYGAVEGGGGGVWV